MSIQNKTQTIPRSEANSFENALVLQVDTSELSARNARNKYTERKHWVEFNSKFGYRYCTASFDSSRNYWCKPKKGTYSTFLAIVTDEVSQIGIIGFGRYDDAETMQKLLDGYEFCEENTKYLNLLITAKTRSKQAYDAYKEEAEEAFKQTRKDASTFKQDHFYTKKEIVKCTEDLELIKVVLYLYGVAKGKRKRDFQSTVLAYYIPSNEISIDDMMEKLESKAEETLKAEYRFWDSVKMIAKNCTFRAPTDGSMFYGMSEMLMSSLKEVRLETENRRSA